jgi:hypothetical protein
LVIQLITALIAEPLNGPVVMKPEFPRADQERQVSPYAQEIEYALIVQRMINAVKDDPTQMRLTIYEFARARLKIDTSGIDGYSRGRAILASRDRAPSISSCTAADCSHSTGDARRRG